MTCKHQNAIKSLLLNNRIIRAHVNVVIDCSVFFSDIFAVVRFCRSSGPVCIKLTEPPNITYCQNYGPVCVVFCSPCAP